ncbi:conserved hypothetical protein [Mucor ambiguus]|uniref:ABC transporter domain-containing protein n=1 Tax=Mucor ambiguus TaxID=91626 RepID=A0A0C9N5N7_9FUNG|nr:conserved hypothetical protein [Mucor ambiguus]
MNNILLVAFVFCLLLAAQDAVVQAATANHAAVNDVGFVDYTSKLSGPFFTAFKEKEECPPCFNCMLPGFECLQFANCTDYDGKCKCPSGFGGDDCKQPLCGGLDEGRNRYPRENGTVCDCPDGWEGINCNVCTSNSVCDALVPTGQNGTCYRGGLTVYENHQMCNVTNRKILDQLKDQLPQVTFSCNRHDATCDFQFWVDQIESFYCHLDTCAFKQTYEYDRNTTKYTCDKIDCRCIKDEMLCGKDGSIDLTDFLNDEIQGPASFNCNGKECVFSEPAMNDLISAVFGDDSIFLNCNSGECLHYTMVPGFERGERPINWTMIGSGLGGVAAFLVFVGSVVTFLAKKSTRHDEIRLADDETGKLMSEHTPVDLVFDHIAYTLPNVIKPILVSTTGRVRSGEVLAILGPSGAGKTTLLDILANRTKTGQVTGSLYVNGKRLPREEYAQLIGYVDQEDTMIPTLTVYETILYSALLRLPRSMSTAAKKFRVMEVMQELNIDGIKDSKIGQPGSRSISGGERRRVSIACELVTSPSILFLDEPTSGLDAYNAFNVVESLVSLARSYKRTIVFTIHQPRSNIVTLFDHLVLLAKGCTIYAGPQTLIQQYFSQIGYTCPPGFNIGDYAIDLTMGAIKCDSERDTQVDVIVQDTSDNNNATDGLTPHLRQLAQAYDESNMAVELREEIAQSIQDTGNNSSGSSTSAILSGDTAIISTHKKPTFITQFRILSDRTFKNLYRNPMLMFAHYGIAVVLALVCGGLFYQVSNTIAGFQNRMGLFFFYEALLGFMCLTSLQVFSTERILFIRERANGYYSPGTYFLAKILFDIIPLRVVPPLMMGLISYYMVGLVEGVDEFLKFLLVLVLFNLTAAALCLAIGVVFKNVSMANLLSVLVMLFSMLFAGLLLNKGSFLDKTICAHISDTHIQFAPFFFFR